jgi:hypothetical protein
VTRKFYREDRSGEPFNDSSMVASLADMRKEEARSRRLGRQEDLEAEREELRRVNAKETKLARARKCRKAQRKAKGRAAHSTGGARTFLDDGGDDDDEDDDGDLSLSD